MKNTAWGIALSLLALTTAPVAADVWDEGGDADNTLVSPPDNELFHGTTQVHDLAALSGPAEDVDFYSVYSGQYRSYEGLIVGTTGDLNNGGTPDFKFDRVDGNAAVLQSFVAVSPFTFSRSIAWESGPGAVATYLRVSGAGCGTSCTAADQYTLRFYETTYAIPRFNNSGSQVTSLLVQNTSLVAVAGTVWYFNTAGALITSQTFGLSPQALLVFNTAALVPAQSGSILISHNGHYGSLAGKAVALEPSTGFTFDTLMVPQPN